MELIVYRKGVAHTIIYDECDHDLVSSRKWHISQKGYAVCNISLGYGRQKVCLMHRLILGISDSSIEVDHANRISLDNRRCNLRVCDRSENNKNRKVTGDVPYMGVYIHSKKKSCKKIYASSIRTSTGRKYLGCYLTAIEAAMAYDVAAKIHHGKFANLNFK